MERIAAMQPENWSSAPHQLTMGTPQGSPLSSVLFSVFTKGLAELNQSGSSTILTQADEGLILQSKDRHPVGSQSSAKHRVSQWCHDSGSLINPDKAQIPWCTIDSRTSIKATPAVTFNRAVVEQANGLISFGIHSERILI